MKGSIVEYDLDGMQRGIFEIPEYLNTSSYEVMGNIMFSVTGLLFPNLNISILDIEDSLMGISSDQDRVLWGKYFKDISQASQYTIH
ncbi:hypothetical protein HOO68_03175 [Candidatus Gracilibacteria bacterium]|nr:hypothetical protein [Candidatus Gracilibacteria bacterium]